MNDFSNEARTSNNEARTSNTMGNLLAIVGMVVAIALQMVYFNSFGFINWVDGIATGIIAGACIFIGFRIGKGTSGERFPVFLVVIAVVTVILGFTLGISYFVYSMGGYTFGEAFFIFFDEYLFADLQGTTLYHSQGVIDFGIAIGIAILIVGAKYFASRADQKAPDDANAIDDSAIEASGDESE